MTARQATSWLLAIMAIGLIASAVIGANQDRPQPSDPIPSTKGDYNGH